VARRSNASLKDPEAGGTSLVNGANLKPIRRVRRELTSPDGSTHEVEVPVYPPFRLETAEERTTREKREKKAAQCQKAEDDAVRAAAADSKASLDSEASAVSEAPAESETPELDGEEGSNA